MANSLFASGSSSTIRAVGMTCPRRMREQAEGFGSLRAQSPASVSHEPGHQVLWEGKAPSQPSGEAGTEPRRPEGQVRHSYRGLRRNQRGISDSRFQIPENIIILE